MELYFNASSAISPLGSFENEPPGLVAPGQTMGYFVSKEPDYKNTIDKKHLRRMSRFIKMAVANAMNCLTRAGLEQPDAIITGTGLGCVTDTIDFLQQINANSETMLNPTGFMQSTHNTASGQIALLLNCRNFNITFSHKNISFESALLQAKMMLNGENYRNILVGGMDEITPQSFELITQTSCIRRYAGNHPLIPGEGAAFFILTNQPSAKNIARFDAMSVFCGKLSEGSFSDLFQHFTDDSHFSTKDVDLILTGAHPSDEVYGLLSNRFSENPIIGFKDYCGEYDTSTSFALWLALNLINKSIDGCYGPSPENVLIHNQGSGSCHSFILVSKC
ncbi:MAG: beta-ketoacyl synthase chain length factor [Bacteroidota bacterium]